MVKHPIFHIVIWNHPTWPHHFKVDVSVTRCEYVGLVIPTIWKMQGKIKANQECGIGTFLVGIVFLVNLINLLEFQPPFLKHFIGWCQWVSTFFLCKGLSSSKRNHLFQNGGNDFQGGYVCTHRGLSLARQKRLSFCGVKNTWKSPANAASKGQMRSCLLIAIRNCI